MTKEQLDGDELESLLEARSLGMVSFTLLDVREPMEFNQAHIVGTDKLIPTSNFYGGIEELNSKKEEQIIVYCLSGSRSYQVQQAMGSLGFKKVSNLAYGIGSFRGDVQSV
jgi:rhodanese-related sulfurtransferase